MNFDDIIMDAKNDQFENDDVTVAKMIGLKLMTSLIPKND